MKKGQKVLWISQQDLGNDEDIICENEMYTKNFPDRSFDAVIDKKAYDELKEWADQLVSALEIWMRATPTDQSGNFCKINQNQAYNAKIALDLFLDKYGEELSNDLLDNINIVANSSVPEGEIWCQDGCGCQIAILENTESEQTNE